MLDILNSYLATACTPEMHNVLRDAHSVLGKVSNYDYDGTYTSILMTDGDRDEGETAQLIVDTTRQFLDQILKQHGVVLIPDASIDMKTKTLQGLMEIPTYGNAEELHSIILQQHSPIETFSEIMSVFTAICTEEYMMHCESINSALIGRIEEMVVKKQEETPTDEELLIRRAHVDRLKAFCAFVQKEDLTMVHQVKEGMPVGYPFKLYADSVGRNFEQWPAERVAHEMYAMALCSVDGMNNPRAAIGAQINNYIADTSLITKVDVIVNDLMVKINK